LPSEAALAGRRALVTAGSNGIGRATAATLRSHAAEVFITGTSERTAETAGAIGAAGHAIADFTDPAAAEEAARAAIAVLGGVDILVANTGGPKPSAFSALADDDWLGAYHLILGSAIALTRAVLPGMADRGWGRVIYLTSTAGVVKPLSGLHLSNVMRAGVAGLSASLVAEHGPSGIDTDRRRQITGFLAERRGVDVATLMEQELGEIPARRLGRADEVASLVAHLAGEHAGFITGAVHVIDGGMTQA